MATTIQDVARRARVGVGTVSRVLNNHPQVSETTRQRVLQAIRDLDFVPSVTARRLSLGKTLTIAAIVPFFTHPSQVGRLRGVEHVVATSEYDLTIFNVETPQQRDEYFRKVPRRERVDGVIVVSLPPRETDVTYLALAEVPVVFVDCNVPWLASFSRVVEDDVAGGQLAVQHLVDLGHRRIAYLSDHLENPFGFTPSRDRYEGYRRVLEGAGIPFRPEYHAQGAHGRAEAHRLARRLLALPEPPTAIFAASDTQALGVMEAAHELGLRVPQDLSVIGYDDIEVAEYLGLTTVRQMLFESGKRGAELLLALLREPGREPVCETSPTQLMIRRTTAPPPDVG